MRWPASISEAREIQEEFKNKVKIVPLGSSPRYIAGVDAAFFNDKVVAVACLYKYPEAVPLEENFAIEKIPFPYIPGYLSFREGPAAVKALEGLKIKPDLILFDGQGIAHPKGLGIASHIGVILDIPSVGCAKSRLVGEYEEPGKKKGDWSPLNYQGKVVGAVLRSKDGVRPLFVSPGHRIDLKGSIKIILSSTTKYRMPEPLRRADILSRKIKREFAK